VANIDRIAKDFDSLLDSLIKFASTEYGEHTAANRIWSDFNVSSFSRNWAEIVAYLGDQLMFYQDNQATQAYLSSLTIPSYAFKIAKQYGYEIPTQQAASGKLQFVTTGPYVIPKGTIVQKGTETYFTLRQVQGNSADTVDVDAIHGQQVVETIDASGDQNELIILSNPDVIIDQTNSNAELRSPIVKVNGNEYTVVNSPVESGPGEKIVTKTLQPDGRLALVFGDNVFGRRLVENETIQVTYRVGGGTVGNAEIGEITTLSAEIENVDSVTNSTAFTGGIDIMQLAQLKEVIPLYLKTIAGAINLDDYADILKANYTQVLTASAAKNNIDEGIDINVYVLPQADSVTSITENTNLYNTLTDFLENKKTVAARFVIKDAEEIQVLTEFECKIRSDASRAAVISNITERMTEYYDLQTGGQSGTGIDFAQTLQIGDIFDILSEIDEILSFDIKKYTVSPRLEENVSSQNQNFFKTDVQVFDNVEENEWLIATAESGNPETDDGQVKYKVFKRTLGSVTALTDSSITDDDLDLTLIEGDAIVIQDTLVTDAVNVFQPDQHNGKILVDQNNNLWTISKTNSKSVEVSSPALNDAGITTVANGEYRIVKSFAGQKLAVNGLFFSILYNDKNTFYSPNASFNVIATVSNDFFLSEEQTNQGTYGVPLSIATATPEGVNPGDLVRLGFTGDPVLAGVNTDYVLIDRLGEIFELTSISDNETEMASYFLDAYLTNNVTLNEAGVAGEAYSMPINVVEDLYDVLPTVSLKLKKVDTPAGGILVDIYSDANGKPDTLLGSSDLADCSAIPQNNFNTISFRFSSAVTMLTTEKYHLVVRGDNAYRLSKLAGDGEIQVGIDTTVTSYKPEAQATGHIIIADYSKINTFEAATNSVTVLDNNIRHNAQATAIVKIISNDWNGDNKLIIAGTEIAEGTHFTAGGTITASRDALINAINLYLGDDVTATPIVDTNNDSILLTAGTNYLAGEGNTLTLETSEADPQNFELNSTSFNGGLNGDKLVIGGAKFLNTGEVEFEYSETTGEVTFSSPVSLPTFVDGDLFVDGAENTFEIIAIDDATDKVTLASGLTVDNTIKNNYSGAIQRSIVAEFGVDGLVAGATIDDTAENIKSYIEGEFTSVNIVRTANELAITQIGKGAYGNNFTITTEDIGTENSIDSRHSGLPRFEW